MATIEVIDPETGEVTHEEHDFKVVDLESQTRLQREMRAMVKREFLHLSRTQLLPVEEALKLTAGVAQLIAKSVANDALRALVEDLKPKQVAMELPGGNGAKGGRQ